MLICHGGEIRHGLRTGLRLASLAGLCALGMAHGLAAPAQASAERIMSYVVGVVIQRNGLVRIQETITYDLDLWFFVFFTDRMCSYAPPPPAPHHATAGLMSSPDASSGGGGLGGGMGGGMVGGGGGDGGGGSW